MARCRCGRGRIGSTRGTVAFTGRRSTAPPICIGLDRSAVEKRYRKSVIAMHRCRVRRYYWRSRLICRLGIKKAPFAVGKGGLLIVAQKYALRNRSTSTGIKIHLIPRDATFGYHRGLRRRAREDMFAILKHGRKPAGVWLAMTQYRTSICTCQQITTKNITFIFDSTENNELP